MKGKRIIKLSCLREYDLKENDKIVVGLRNVESFKDKLIQLGFSQELRDGEKILPKAINTYTRRNAERSFTVDKTLPKEKYYQSRLWTRQEWIGGGQTREVTDWVDIQRERYARVWSLPFSVEFELNYRESSIDLLADVMEYNSDNEQLLINTINIFLSIFGEFEILAEDLKDKKIIKTIRLNWEIFPIGQTPWEETKEKIRDIAGRQSRNKKEWYLRNLDFIHLLRPDFKAIGKAGFSGYVVFGFESKGIYILESIFPDNATYIFDKDWEELSKLTKAEIICGNLQKARIIHYENWEENIWKIFGKEL